MKIGQFVSHVSNGCGQPCMFEATELFQKKKTGKAIKIIYCRLLHVERKSGLLVCAA